MKPRILVFCDYYLPGIKGGGGMWAVKNLVDRFSDRYEFKIVTRNHDGRDDRSPYSDVKTNCWNSVGPAEVYYLSPRDITPRTLAQITNELEPDAIFLNSVFSRPTVMYLTARRLGLLKRIPTILAVCGELAPAALALKSTKKNVYLSAAKSAGLFNGLIFRASFDEERQDIQRVMGEKARIMIAPDLTPASILPHFNIDNKPRKDGGSVRLAFVSRIARKKNLAFLLKVLSTISSGTVSLDIAGAEEDPVYLSECKALAESLGSNISVYWHGPVGNEAALELMAASHFFVLPTLNENFGYVFIEALAAGCPLIISDQTVWRDLEEKGVGWDLDLNDGTAWGSMIERSLAMENEEFQRMAAASRAFALGWLSDRGIEEDTAKLLSYAISTS